MKTIPLTQGKFAIVDDEDYQDLIQFKWHAHCHHKNYYAKRAVWINKKTSAEQMHRRILGLKAGDGKYGDHINGNGLDNRRSNLRVCTNKENIRNSRRRYDNKSGLKGVWLHKQTGKWVTQIRVNDKSLHVGLFKSKIAAARAYNRAAIKYFGKFAKLNQINIEGIATDGKEKRG